MNATNDTRCGIRHLALPLAEGRFWLKLLGGLLIANGIITALTIVGLIVAWLPIWMGVVLFQAAGALTQAHENDDEQAMLRGQQRLRTFFTISGVLALIALLFSLTSIIFGIGGMAFTGSMGMHNMGRAL